MKDEPESDVEGEEGEVVAERKGRNADGGEEKRDGGGSQHGKREGDPVLDEAVDEEDGEGEDQSEDAERRDGDDWIHVAQKNQQQTHKRGQQVEKDALVAGVGEEGARPFDLADEIDDGDLWVKQ